MISENYNCYTRLYKRKLESEFSPDFVTSLGVSDRFFPLVYICLKHRRIPSLKRNVFVASDIEQILLSNPKWKLLKSRIELGEDINNYISKKTREWHNSDYLLYSCNIYHIHLRSSIKGGIGDELIYAIVKNDSLYVIHYGTHNDIFKPGELIKACESEWPGLHFMLETDEDNSSIAPDDELFKHNACDPRLGFTLLKPAAFFDEKSGKMKFISNHQNTATILLESEEGSWNLPFKCAMAFSDEEKLMHHYFFKFHSHYGVYPDSMELDLENRKYIFKLPTLRGYGDYHLTKIDAPEILTASFPSDEAQLNWHL
ncbi:hypothetical protein [Pectobacterium versatile]|uniref:hypothetical protein n=1 Tax=Pectobacterium versatile TaxID=2488639 RepID=UPI0032EE4DED